MQKYLRRIHLLLGCFFAPALLYFALSGAWQLFGYHRPLKSGDQQEVRETLQQWSNPHMHSAMPNAMAKTSQSRAFKWFAVFMAAGFALTALVGVYLAFKFFRPRWLVAVVIFAGIALPTAMLWSAVRNWNSEFTENSR